jgi:predicted phosphodiesterase
VRGRGLDGVICGHIHSAAIKEVEGLTYINCGDWVDSCTAIVEHFDGRMELIQNWQHIKAPATEEEKSPAAARAPPDLKSSR